MNLQHDTARHLIIDVQNTEPNLSQDEASENDPNNLIPSFSMIPFTLPARALMPRIWQTSTLGTARGSLITINVSPTDIAAKWPSMFTHYALNRIHLRFRLILRATWNMTGFLSFFWIPSRSTSGTNFFTTADVSFPYSCPPNMRAFARIGVDQEITLSTPYLSQFAAMRNFGSQSTPQDGIANTFTLYILNLTAIRSIPDAVQSVSYTLWAEPIDIKVGAFTGA